MIGLMSEITDEVPSHVVNKKLLKTQLLGLNDIQI